MPEPVKIIKPIHTVVEFTDMIDRYGSADKRRASEGKYSWENESEQILFYYSLLGGDAVVWDQEVKILQTQDISLVSPKDPQRTLMFTYFFEANQPIHVDSGTVFERKSLVFSNDQGSYRFVMPKGFEGHILQIILSESFVRNYISPKYLEHPLVDSIINHSGSELLLLKEIPSYLNAELRKIAERMSVGAAGKHSKLPLLQLLARFLDVFFGNFVGNERKLGKTAMDKDFKQQVKSLMNKNKLDAFWGISYYSSRLNLTESTFKRLFTKYFKASPLDYFKTLQHQYAQNQLQSGKYSVTEVAYKLGYTSNANFVRSYKKHMGHTPGQDLPKPSITEER